MYLVANLNHILYVTLLGLLYTASNWKKQYQHINFSIAFGGRCE